MPIADHCVAVRSAKTDTHVCDAFVGPGTERYTQVVVFSALLLHFLQITSSSLSKI